MDSRRLIAAGVAAVVGALVLVGLMLALARDPDVKNNLGERVFTVGDADSLATEIDDRGPLLFQDLLGGDRHLMVDHLGAEEWLAYATELADGCRLELVRESGDVRNSCTGSNRRPVLADVCAGLRAFRTEVNDDNELVVDLNLSVDCPTP
jgi:hypothetical protein